ncbi:hypothetical protein ACJA25_02925 [Mycoplasmopsis hyopharyngis]|uniref:hypothetical protein n=1 Tax=Mycoplasmopsis hyopharyngis TaxID=29558 RepID=UPI003873A3B8
MYDFFNFLSFHKTGFYIDGSFSTNHIFIFLACFSIAGALGFYAKHKKLYLLKTDYILVSIVLFTIFLEIIKIISQWGTVDKINKTFYIDLLTHLRSGYRLYLPDFICSIFMWSIIIYLLFPNRQVREGIMCFYATYLCISGLAILLTLDDLKSINVNLRIEKIHSIFYHMLMVIVGFYLIIAHSLYITFSRIIKAFLIFLFFVLFAIILNSILVKLYKTYNWNIFLISPFHGPNNGIDTLLKWFKINFKDYDNRLNPVIFTISLFIITSIFWMIISLPFLINKWKLKMFAKKYYNGTFKNLNQLDQEICKDYANLIKFNDLKQQKGTNNE